MGRIAEAAEAMPAVAPSACKVRQVRDGLPPEESTEMDALLARLAGGEVSISYTSRVLRRAGLDIGYTCLRTHLNRECRCYRGANG